MQNDQIGWEFSHNDLLFTLGSYVHILKITEVAHIYGLLFSTAKALNQFWPKK
jgi:hypothetical protein